MIKTTILFLLVYSVMFSQNYKPMLETNAEWQVTSCYFGCLTDSYFTDGDTLVGGNTYKILDGYHYISRTFLLREDVPEKKVYLNIINSGKAEYLLYDFSLSVGDSIDMKNPITPFPENAGYYTLDSIIPRTLYDGLDYKHYYLSPSTSNTVSTNNAVWIESIGSLSIINAPSGDPDINGAGHLSCHFRTGLVYSNLDSISACIPDYNLSNAIIHDNLHSTYIVNTLVNNTCIIENTQYIKTIQVYDIKGKLIKTEKINAIKSYSLDISSFNAGMYFIKVSNQDYSKVFKIIKK